MLTHLLKMNSIHISKLANGHIPSGRKNVGKKKTLRALLMLMDKAKNSL